MHLEVPQEAAAQHVLAVGNRQLHVDLDDLDDCVELSSELSAAPAASPAAVSEPISAQQHLLSAVSSDGMMALSSPVSHFDPAPRFNRWLMLVGVMYVATVCGTHPFNWTPWEAILKHAGVFAEACERVSSSLESSLESVSCDAQNAKIASILSLLTLFMFSMTFVAGFLLDICGPRFCSVLGLCLFLTGYVLISLHDRGSNLVLVGFALLGSGMDPTFFGMLCVANLFPGHAAAVIAGLGGCRSLTLLFPLLFKPFVLNDKLSLDQVCYVWLALSGVAFVLVLLLLPRHPYRLVVTLPPGSMAEPLHKEYSKLTSVVFAQTGAASTHVVKTHVTKVRRGVAKTISGYAQNKWRVLVHQVRETAVLVPQTLYWLVVIVSIGNMIRNNWMLTSASQQYSPAAVDYLTVLNAISFVVGPTLGVVVDLFGPITAMLVLGVTNTGSTLTLLLAQLTDRQSAVQALSFISCSLALPGIGFLLSQVYCYMAVVFPPEHMGKLVGFAAFVSGIVALVVDPLYKWAQAHNFWTVDLGVLILNCCTTAIIVTLFPLLRRKRRRDLLAERNKHRWSIEDDHGVPLSLDHGVPMSRDHDASLDHHAKV